MPPTYAAKADLVEYVEDSGVALPADEEAVDRLLERAERDIDRVVGARAVDAGTGLKFVPASLETRERDDLKRATCAQAEYRVLMGEQFFARPQHERVTGPEFSVEGSLPGIGPKVWDELGGSGLLRLTTTWQGKGGDPPWYDFAYNVNADDDADPRPL